MTTDQHFGPRPDISQLPTSAIPPGTTHIKVEIAIDGTVTWWAGVTKLIRGAGLGSGTGSMERIDWRRIDDT